MKNLKSSLFSKFESSKISTVSAICGGIRYTQHTGTGNADTLDDDGTLNKNTGNDTLDEGGDSHPGSSWE